MEHVINYSLNVSGSWLRTHFRNILKYKWWIKGVWFQTSRSAVQCCLLFFPLIYHQMDPQGNGTVLHSSVICLLNFIQLTQMLCTCGDLNDLIADKEDDSGDVDLVALDLTVGTS